MGKEAVMEWRPGNLAGNGQGVAAGRRILIQAASPPGPGGGSEQTVREMVRGLQSMNYDVRVLDLETSLPHWLERCLRPWGLRLSHSLAGYFLGRATRKRLGEGVAAVISTGDAGVFPLSRRPRSAKWIHLYQGTHAGEAELIRPFITRLGYFYLKWWNCMVVERACGRGKALVCNSEQTREEVQRFFGYRAVIIGLPLDTRRFRPVDHREARRRLGLQQDARFGLFVGRTTHVKNFTLVRKLIDALPEVRWLLALLGETPSDMLHHPRVRVLRRAAGEELPLLYNAADFSLCPSLYESFGYVVAESLACGTPVVATVVPASRLFLSEPPLDRLLIRDPDAVGQFCAAVEEVLGAPEVYRRAALERARPEIDRLMGTENWVRRLCEVTGL